LRFALPMFPVATVTFAPWIAVLSTVAIIYGAFMALAQHDVKKLVAYSSVSHLGFVTLGLVMGTEASVQGALLQMVNHGLSTGALFLAIGVLYERRHTRLIAEYGGLAAVMPVFATVLMLATLSSIGLPGLNGFVGEFLVLAGTYTSTESAAGPWFAALAALGVILGAVYMLWMYQRVMFGPVKNPANKGLRDLSAREVLVFAPIVAMMIVVGVYPRFVIDPMAPAVKAFADGYRDARLTARARLELEERTGTAWASPAAGAAGAPRAPGTGKGGARTGVPGVPGVPGVLRPGMRTAMPGAGSGAAGSGVAPRTAVLRSGAPSGTGGAP
jgi:NADH-quinone oxidoreductase subunit M